MLEGGALWQAYQEKSDEEPNLGCRVCIGNAPDIEKPLSIHGHYDPHHFVLSSHLVRTRLVQVGTGSLLANSSRDS